MREMVGADVALFSMPNSISRIVVGEVVTAVLATETKDAAHRNSKFETRDKKAKGEGRSAPRPP